MYTVKNYKNGKAVQGAFASGETVAVFQPGPFGPTPKDGPTVIEGPHYPQPHTFYLEANVKDGVIVTIKVGAKHRAPADVRAILDKQAAKKAART